MSYRVQLSNTGMFRTILCLFAGCGGVTNGRWQAALNLWFCVLVSTWQLIKWLVFGSLRAEESKVYATAPQRCTVALKR